MFLKNYTLNLAFFILLIFFTNTYTPAQKSGDSAEPDVSVFNSSARHWYGIYDESNTIFPRANQLKYKSNEIEKIADNILIYQRNNGGWPKNYDMLAILTDEQKDSLIRAKDELNTTFDNNTTYSHVGYLAKVYNITHAEKYKKACLKGIEFILSAQYSNGGWPQYYPLRKNYSRCITFNDGAYIGIMKVLKKVLGNNSDYSFIESGLQEKVRIAYDKGLECILKCQIKDNGHLTAWCQQHNEIDLSPAWARAFEPPSICNMESADIVQFLMSIDNPGREVINSIHCAVKWFEDSKIKGIRVKTINAPPLKSKWKTTTSDKIVTNDSTAPPIWTRFYELGTHRPLFCDRNGKFLYSLADVSRERRSGYGWYGYSPQDVLDRYPEWRKKWATGDTASSLRGNVSYKLVRSENPNEDELEAYGIITQIMDSAVYYYNLYTDATKQIIVYYIPDSSVRADGNYNGNLRFGPNRYFMNLGTAIHEISHTIGVGTKQSWFSFGEYSDSLRYAIYNGVNAINILQQLTGDPQARIYRDYQHFWPFGLNYVTEYKSKTDLINHCKIVNAMLKDGL